MNAVIWSYSSFKVNAPFHTPTKVTTPSGEFVRQFKDENYFYSNSDALQFEADAVRKSIQKGKQTTNNYSCKYLHYPLTVSSAKYSMSNMTILYLS